MISTAASSRGRIIVLREFDAPGEARPTGPAAQRRIRPENEDDDRQRMRVNLAAAIALLILIGVGVWLTTEMVESQKAQGCYQSGGHTCSLL
jgi:hypothetical protein